VVPSISFPESHDTPRLFQEMNGNVAGVKQRLLLASFFSAGSMIPCGFEFGFRKRMHVVETRPQDWETPNIDLCDFIGRVNAVKKRYRIFGEECPTTVLPHENPNILLLRKASSKTSEEALIILNKDAGNYQHFYVDNLHVAVQSGAPFRDVSPEYPWTISHETVLLPSTAGPGNCVHHRTRQGLTSSTAYNESGASKGRLSHFFTLRL